MDLKEIHLSGFKSFADKTVIRFEEGVTCIVGPNGCGKSNVADAVRWVLGEQSPKSLRGGNMQDVIFGGTLERKPHSSCEVTLVFDNTNKIFNLDCTEVSMTRRVNRNGDSKYMVNGQPSRLKDMVALYHGIGLGKEGYSIIGQGKVEQIMNARPEDRRLVFEEATGLMVYKSRKNEIERKIRDSEENLYIYRQRIDEAERRLGPLSKQAEAAREFNKYSEALKIDEANTYIYRYENAESEKDKFKKDIATFSDKIITLNTQIELINRQTEENRMKISSADAKLTDLNDKRVELSVGNERKDGEFKLVNEKISTYRSQLTAAREFLDGGKIRIGEIDDELARISEQGRQNTARLLTIENETEILRSAISALDNKIQVFEKLSEDNRLSQLSSAQNLSELKKNLGTLEARKEATIERIKELEKEVLKVGQRKERISDELAVVRKDLKLLRDSVADGMREFEEKSEEMRDMQLTVNDFNQKLFASNGQLASLRDNLEMYISLKNRFEGYQESVRRLLLVAKTNPDIKKRLHGAVADIITTEQKYETAIETALGGAMQNIVTANSDDAQYLIEYLKRNGGRASFMPVKSMRPRPDSREIQRAVTERGAFGTALELVNFDDYYYNVASNLLGNTLICDNIANANAISKKYGNTFKIVTLEGDIVETSGRMTGGSSRRKDASLLSNERKIQECKEKIVAQERYIEKMKKAIAESEQLRREAEEEVEKLRDKYQSANAEIAALTQREAALTTQLREAESDEEVYLAACNEFREKLKALEFEEASSSQNEEKLKSLRESAEAELTSQKSQCDMFKEERAKKSVQLRDYELEYTSLQSALKKYEEDKERLTAEKEDLVKRILDTEEEKKIAEENLAMLEKEAEAKELTDEEKKAVQAIVDEIAKLTEEKEKINELQISLDTQKEDLQEKHSKNIEKRYRLELEVAKIDTNLENMRLRVEEAYGMDYEGCLALRKDNFDVVQAATDIAVLKGKITKLGAVNPNAEIEYEDERVHYDEMVTQRDDLQKAIDDLTLILNDVRGEMLRIFNTGFEEINENFKTTFKELFGGGKAELQLEEVEDGDPLNAGVEIVACPPGKKLTKISLLSGGERALTAIAILFAILKSRPMPFCILDEIEAALDDANVDRFASYLKRFSKETQFIVITHRKPTMNQADTLFGVTMQEKGVSKIVSVKLSEVETKLGSGTVE